jgi:hypothetical protein
MAYKGHTRAYKRAGFRLEWRFPLGPPDPYIQVGVLHVLIRWYVRGGKSGVGPLLRLLRSRVCARARG